MKMYLLSILFIICGNSYANSDSQPDDYSYQDVIKYRKMLNKIPEDKFLTNTLSSLYAIPPEINKNTILRPNDIILKNDNTITVWFTQKVLKDGPILQSIKLRTGDKLKQQYNIDCYNYSSALLNMIVYRGDSVLTSQKESYIYFNDITPQTVLASVATRACMFQTALERKKALTSE
ncbi:hypothetical protein ACNPQK_18680 [Acinetobacter guillouiae]|uniref:hypothetical protein n=1 Tax=Acinetobacter guillouiae TaxID=106649 RepID=UPI003AF4458F